MRNNYRISSNSQVNREFVVTTIHKSDIISLLIRQQNATFRDTQLIRIYSTHTKTVSFIKKNTVGT